MSAILRSRRPAPVAAVTLGALTLGLGLANVPLDHITHQPGALLSEVIGLALLGTSAAATYIVTSLVLLAAVSVDALSRRGKTS